jgi:5-methylcytosine-specific restriction enzyme subunit McrC
MTVLTVRERDRLPIGGLARVLSHEDAATLARLSRSSILPSRAFSWEHQAIRFGPFCGVLRIGNLTIEVLPKVVTKFGADDEARGTLIAMLRAAGELSALPVGTAPLGLQRLHLLDVFIIDFCERVNALLRRGAVRSYIAREENLVSARGRIHLTVHVRRNLFDRSHIFCRYEEFSVNNPHNQALKAVLARLLNHAVAAETKGAVNALLRRMEDVSNQPPSALHLARLRFDRLTRPWQPLFERAAWFLKGMYPDVRAGASDNICLVFDMERLFEAYVGVLIRRSWRATGAEVKLQGPRRYFANATRGRAFEMRPDATVLTDRRLMRIYDAKWKRLDGAAPNWGIAREDIYQMASYASGYDCQHISLLYPCDGQTGPGLVETFQLADVHASRVDVFALDLQALVRGAPLPAELGPQPAQSSEV